MSNRLIKSHRIELSWVFAAVLAGLVLFTRSRWESGGLFGALLFFLGVVLAGIGAVGRVWCSIYISGYKDGVLITTGPYSLCRNPLYLFSLAGAIGVGLATETLLVPTLVAVGFALYYPQVISLEEEKLRRRHGEAFEAYCRSVPRLIPAFAKPNEPETYSVKPIIIRKRLIDSLWFVWGIGFLKIVEALHAGGFLPVLFGIY